MKAIEISNKVHLIRHWGKWYRVQRGAAQWQPLKPLIKGGQYKLPDYEKSLITPEQAAAAEANLKRMLKD